MLSDLRVLFAAGADTGYRAWLADADGNRLGAEVPFAPFLTEDDYEDLRWYLEEYMDLPDGGAVTRAQRIEGNLVRWGRMLHDALFSGGENRDLLQRLLDSPEPSILTIATRDPALLRLPWELMADDAGSLAQRLSVRRQLEKPETTTPRPAQLPLRILYIVSRPADAGFIDPRHTAKALFDALDPLGASVRVDFCRPPTLARMEEMLRDGQQAGNPYSLVHFDGHGTFLPEKQIGVLCFEAPDDGFGGIAETFRDYLQRSGRLHERDAWVKRLKDAMAKQSFTEEAAEYERLHAWTRFTQGDPQGSVDQFQALIERLRHTREFDSAFELAAASLTLGRVLHNTGASAQAVPILGEAAGLWEALVEKAGGRLWEELLTSPDHTKARSELANLSAAMGDLANALSGSGKHDEALTVAEKCLGIQKKLGNHREGAVAHGQCASILMATGRYDEADVRFDLALACHPPLPAGNPVVSGSRRSRRDDADLQPPRHGRTEGWPACRGARVVQEIA